MNQTFLFWWSLFFLFAASFSLVVAPWWSMVCLVVGFSGGGLAWLLSAQREVKTSVSASARMLEFNRFVTDITHVDSTAYREQELVGRKEELETARILLRRPGKNSLLVVGAPGCGKAVFLHALIRDFRAQNVRKPIRSGLSFFVLDLKKVFSEASGTEQEKEHFLRALFEEMASRGRALVIVENGAELIGESALHKAGALLCEYAEHPKLSLLLSLRENDYRRAGNADELGRSFETLFLRSPDKDEAWAITDHHFRALRGEKGIFTPEARRAWRTAVESLINDLPGPYHEKVIRFGEDLVLYWAESGTKRINEETVEAFLQAKYPEEKRNTRRATPALRGSETSSTALLPRTTWGVNAVETLP